MRANRLDFFDHQNYVKKSTWNQRGFFDQRNHTEKVREITSKKVRVNGVDFQTSEITLKEVRGYNVNFSISKITSKKYVEITWKFAEIWSSTYRYNIDVASTSIRRGVPVG